MNAIDQTFYGIPIEELSPRERIRLMTPEERDKIEWLKDPKKVGEKTYQWRDHNARPKQLPPPGDWYTWMVRAGRAWGKTRTGAAWVNERAMAQPDRWMALVARTPADARDVMITGPGGILKNVHPKDKPSYEPSNRRLTWPNGSYATIFSDEVPDQLRGFSGDTAWIDEFAKFKHPQDTWDNLTFGMREKSKDKPRVLITTTPRPMAILRAIEKLPSTVTVVGSSYENRGNLSEQFFHEILRYEGTRIGRQELKAEIIDDLPGALWTREMIERSRVKEAEVPEMVRVVVGVDPSGTSGTSADKSNQVGIVAAGLGTDGKGYVLSDNTCSLSPAGWGKLVVEVADEYEADRIVAEKNFGGAMVEFVIRTADPNASIKMVNASRGKLARAEPVSALFEQDKVKMVGAFPELEDQLCALLPEGYSEEGSPDRADAMVWAFTELMLKKKWQEDGLEGIGVPIAG